MATDVDGSGYHPSVVPSSLITTDGHDFAVHLDPASLPRSDITSTGLVTIEVAGGVPGGSDFAESMISVRAVILPDGSYGWTDPQAPAEFDIAGGATSAAHSALVHARESGFAPTRVVAERLKPVHLNVGKFVVHGSLQRARAAALGALRTSGASQRRSDMQLPSDSSVVIDDPVLADSKCGSDGAGDVPGATRAVKVLIGQSAPIGDDRSRMTFNQSTNHTSTWTLTGGVGYQDMGTGQVSQESTKSRDREWGFDWAWQGYWRFYDVTQNYQEHSQWYDRCPGSGLGPYFKTWEPGGFPGGVGESQDMPPLGYTKCQEIASVGVWTKDNTDSRAWGQTEGVKIMNWIGINLSSSKGYSDESALLYDMKTDHHWLCGENYLPGHSGKIQERFGNPNPHRTASRMKRRSDHGA